MSDTRGHRSLAAGVPQFSGFVEALGDEIDVASVEGRSFPSGWSRRVGRLESTRDTPLFPPPRFEVDATARATLTVLTGTRAGEIVALRRKRLVLGSAVDADVVVEEPGVSGHHACVERTRDGRFCIQDLQSTNGTFIGSRRIARSLLREREQVQLGPNLRLRFEVLDAAAESLHRQLYASSILDPLTRVFNRRFLSNRLAAEIANVRGMSGDVALLMVDLDRMKQVNDQFGHFAGDRALCLVAQEIRRIIRVEDVLARFGGDEFVILVRASDRGEVTLLAERVRRAIEALPLGARGKPAGMTASVGAASLREVPPAVGDRTLALLDLADERMYLAKAAGGNCSRAS